MNLDTVEKQSSMLKQITEAEQKGKEKEEDDEETMSGVEAMMFFFRAVHREAIKKRKGHPELDELSNQAIKRPKLMKEEICDENSISSDAKENRAAKQYKEKNKLNKKSGETKNEYKCKKCDKAFGTRQSLGGHMRARYEPKDRDAFSPVIKAVKEISTENVEDSSLSSHVNEDVNTQLSLGSLPTWTGFDHEDVNTQLSLGPLPTWTSFDF